MINKYMVEQSYGIFAAGDVVYDLVKYDYGLARDDTEATGEPHKSVTFSPNGDYPSHTIPEEYLQRLD